MLHCANGSALQVIDTVFLFHFKRQRKLSLRFLAAYLLGEDIQRHSHDSIEDACTAIKLYQVRVPPPLHSLHQEMGPCESVHVAHAALPPALVTCMCEICCMLHLRAYHKLLQIASCAGQQGPTAPV